MKLHESDVIKDQWGKKFYKDCYCYIGYCYYTNCDRNKYNFKKIELVKSKQLKLFHD